MIGLYGGIPVVENRMVPKGCIIVSSVGGARTVLVDDKLRFGVRLDMHNYIDRRVCEIRTRLGL